MDPTPISFSTLQGWETLPIDKQKKAWAGSAGAKSNKMAYLHLSLVGNESHGMWESFTDVNSRFNASITYLSSGIFGSGARPQQILSLLSSEAHFPGHQWVEYLTVITFLCRFHCSNGTCLLAPTSIRSKGVVPKRTELQSRLFTNPPT